MKYLTDFFKGLRYDRGILGEALLSHQQKSSDDEDSGMCGRSAFLYSLVTLKTRFYVM